jgi:hypothetical protein
MGVIKQIEVSVEDRLELERIVRAVSSEGSYVKRLLVRWWRAAPLMPSRMPLRGSLRSGPVGPFLTARGRARLGSEEGLGGV